MEGAPPPAEYPRSEAPAPADHKVQSAASWFFWVAGLSCVSTVMHAFGLDFSFMVSMGSTDILGYIGVQTPDAVLKVLAYTVCGLIFLFVAACGYFAAKKHLWAFIVGIGVLMLDALVLFSMLPSSIPSVLFRMWAVYSLIGGFTALRAQRARESLPSFMQVQDGDGSPP